MIYTIITKREYPLREEMVKKRITVPMLEKETGLSRSYLYDVINHKRRVSEDTANKLIKAVQSYK